MIIYSFVLHFIADFLLQSREMGKKKSENFLVLLQHLGIQFIIFLIGLAPAVGFFFALKIATLNTLIHGVIDWNIWKIYKLFAYKRIQKNSAHPLYVKNEWRFWEDHWFYTTIGFDQLLHMSTIVLLLRSLV